MNFVWNTHYLVMLKKVKNKKSAKTFHIKRYDSALIITFKIASNYCTLEVDLQMYSEQALIVISDPFWDDYNAYYKVLLRTERNFIYFTTVDKQVLATYISISRWHGRMFPRYRE